MALPVPRLLNLAHRHVAEWVSPEELKGLEDWLIGPLETARAPLPPEDEEWETIPGLAKPYWY